MLCFLAGLLGIAQVAHTKPLVLIGYVEDAPPLYAAEATHVLLDRPGGRVIIALRDESRELLSLPGIRQRMAGRVAFQQRAAGDIPLVRVLEILSPDWIDLRPAPSAAAFASWNGTGSSLYPSLREEPLPGAGFSVGTIDLDSDLDGVPDHLDDFPFDPTETTDTDGDGTGNNADPDDDNDTIPDDYESQYGLNPLVNDAGEDLDKDGATNLDEFVAGTAANDPKSVFDFVDTRFDSKNGIHLAWPSVEDRQYRIVFSESLVKPFLPVTPDIPATGKVIEKNLSVEPGAAQGFFRIEIRPSTNPKP